LINLNIPSEKVEESFKEIEARDGKSEY